MSRNTAKARRSPTRSAAEPPSARSAGEIVIVAVLSTGAVDVVAHDGDAQAGKIVVDIINRSTPTSVDS